MVDNVYNSTVTHGHRWVYAKHSSSVTFWWMWLGAFDEPASETAGYVWGMDNVLHGSVESTNITDDPARNTGCWETKEGMLSHVWPIILGSLA